MSKRKMNRTVREIKTMVEDTMEAEAARRVDAIAELSTAVEKFAVACHGSPVNFVTDLLSVARHWLPDTIAEEDDPRRMTEEQVAVIDAIDPALTLARLLTTMYQQAVWVAALGRPHPNLLPALRTLSGH